MLSDEEKQAIEFLKEYQDKPPYIIWKDNMPYNKKIQSQIILNLIKKQSKEIEHQKEKRENQKKELAILNTKQIEFNKLVNTVNSYKGQFKRQQKEIVELKEENKEIREWKYVIDNPIDLKKLSELDIIKIFGKSYIAKDLIKAKIEELERQEKEEPDAFLCKRVLQSLLEKE